MHNFIPVNVVLQSFYTVLSIPCYLSTDKTLQRLEFRSIVYVKIIQFFSGPLRKRYDHSQYFVL